MRFKITSSVLALASLVGACSKSDDFSDQEWAEIQKLEPLKGGPPPSPFDFRYQDVDLAKFGQMLFFDKEVAEAITVSGPSGNMGEVKKVGCVNCHDTPQFSDSHQMSQGAVANNGAVPGLSHGRSWLSTNSPALVNLAWYDWTLWAGRFDSMVEHNTGAWGVSATAVAQARFLYAKYKNEYNAAFPDTPLDDRLGLPTTDPANVYPASVNPAAAGAAPGAFEMMPIDAQNNIHQIKANLGRAFNAYVRMLMSPESPFQRYVRDRDYSALTGAQKRGLRLFIGQAACSDCHNGPTLTDNKFHNVGAPNVTMVPSATMPTALNRGRAGSLPTIVANLNAVEANPDAIVFNGAGKFSDDRDRGLQRLLPIRQMDADHCLCRRVDAVAADTACTDAVVASPTQMALRGLEALTCLKYDAADASQCVCRQTDAVTTVDACTSVAAASATQAALHGQTSVACVKYDDTQEGVFRTPTLLNVEMTAPYFHSGAVYTLEDVIWHYNQGGGPGGTFIGTKSPQIRPLSLTDDQVHDLAEFLRSLTGKTPAQQAAEARARGETDFWDWSKNTAKPALMGTGGTMGTGTGGMGGSTGGMGGRGGGGGTGGSTGTGGTGGGGGSGGTGAGGMAGTTGTGGAGGGTGGST
jgi:cytochrome c peroxidase